ncbi:MAG: hypothetical protein JRJ66_05000 [Deltaproteobacteria bacterium]|nr:hypothetical protein [Deltaproteobacteria bacterium]MBW2044006.1 hypothetical protein [Deltaproteobacteria bacterium]RLB31136.1 MAG: hypothetical protein DRH11_13730 [Deltaproteobacteria bacterium]
MTLSPFDRKSLMAVGEALEIAEERTADYYKFSSMHWRGHRYDVKTLSALKREQIIPDAFALLNKFSMVIEGRGCGINTRDFYLICLQDHKILEALKRDKELGLLPLLVYVFTHELVHIVRFCNFFQRFEVSGKDREKEEALVHRTTYDILKDLTLPRLAYILESYRDHRICDMTISYLS